MRNFMMVALALLPGTLPASDEPQAAAGNPVRIQLSRKTEEGKEMLVATVLRGDKPVEGAHVVFSAERLLGGLVLGKDVTLDDGTAAIAFPGDLPARPDGTLKLKAMIDDPPDLRSIFQTSTFTGGRVIRETPDPFPRSLWGPRAPIALLVTFGVLLSGVWSAYAFIFFQLYKIIRGGKP